MDSVGIQGQPASELRMPEDIHPQPTISAFVRIVQQLDETTAETIDA